MLCYVITDEPGVEGVRHIPNAPDLGGGAAITLCGWVDVPHELEHGEPDCPECLKIVRYCKDLRGLPRRVPLRT